MSNLILEEPNICVHPTLNLFLIIVLSRFNKLQILYKQTKNRTYSIL